mmetsp:Transcript_34464/g.97926  ORF Transcript_34464/g.97926 Transcript_34464/m.97926 type:complete len:227 (+) Transcript_34464:185-865(+)
MWTGDAVAVHGLHASQAPAQLLPDGGDGASAEAHLRLCERGSRLGAGRRRELRIGIERRRGRRLHGGHAAAERRQRGAEVRRGAAEGVGAAGEVGEGGDGNLERRLRLVHAAGQRAQGLLQIERHALRGRRHASLALPRELGPEGELPQAQQQSREFPELRGERRTRLLAAGQELGQPGGSCVHLVVPRRDCHPGGRAKGRRLRGDGPKVADRLVLALLIGVVVVF